MVVGIERVYTQHILICTYIGDENGERQGVKRREHLSFFLPNPPTAAKLYVKPLPSASSFLPRIGRSIGPAVTTTPPQVVVAVVVVVPLS